MNRQLSSQCTFFYKVVFPTLWIGGFGLGTAFMFLSPGTWKGNLDVREARWIFLLILNVGVVFLYWSCLRMKKVWLAENSLIISNYLKESSVPLQQIERVSGSILMNPELVWVHFRHPSVFGKRIVFLPTMRLLSGFSKHPIVEELNRLTTEARYRN